MALNNIKKGNKQGPDDKPNKASLWFVKNLVDVQILEKRSLWKPKGFFLLINLCKLYADQSGPFLSNLDLLGSMA